jgi:arginase
MFCSQLAEAVTGVFYAHPRVAVIGGDHSCAIGTWNGVAQAFSYKGDVGLVWIDAHLDAHTPKSSPGGHWHGMPVATLLGHGYAGLVDIAYQGAAIKPENICIVGARSYESPECDLLKQLGVKILTIDDVHRQGFDQAMVEAVAIAKEGTVAYGISIDLDGIDPVDAPGVGSPVVGGIRANEILSGLDVIKQDPNWVALEIAEFNPVNDSEQKTLKLALAMLASMS